MGTQKIVKAILRRLLQRFARNKCLLCCRNRLVPLVVSDKGLFRSSACVSLFFDKHIGDILHRRLEPRHQLPLFSLLSRVV